jgi:NAD-dependent deacetylase
MTEGGGMAGSPDRTAAAAPGAAAGPDRAAVERLAELVRGARSVVALTGAGISVPSGIPDFRSPQTGLWENVDPMEVAHIDVFHADPARFWAFYAQRFHTLDGKEPNGAHHALVELERRGRLDAVITQNIDRLHRKAGTRELIEVHGSIATSSCLICGDRRELDEVRARLETSADGVPRCNAGHPLKPDVVLFGELLPAQAIERAFALAAQADVLLCIGTSLEVHPVAQLPSITWQGGGEVAIITKGPTPFDERAAVRLSGDVVAELEALVAAL